MIHVAIPADRQTVCKRSRKKLKYMSLCIDTKYKWNMNCMIIPVINRANRIVTKGLKKSL
jgi:hypothetical protein